MSDKLDELLGIDRTDPDQIRAINLMENDHNMMNAIVAHREASGTTREEVAEAMGVSVKAVKIIEGLNMDPRLSTLRRYAHAVGVELRTEVITP